MRGCGLVQPEGERPPVGSVAEEAARLFEAFSSWTASGAPEPEPEAPAGYEPGAEVGGPGAEVGGGDGDDHPDRTCDSCGSNQDIGRAASCQVCPLCRGIALLREVRPETVDRLADLAAAVTDSLRATAAQRRKRQGGG